MRRYIKQREKWKTITGYDNYLISDCGRVKKIYKTVPPKILKNQKINSYFGICLCKNGNKKTHIIHHLVWDHFGDKPRNGIKFQVDHINGCRIDNRIKNLQLLSPSDNVSKGWKGKSTSKYTGVTREYKGIKKWRSQINFGKVKNLGRFHNTKIAHAVYLLEKENIKNKIRE